MQENRQKLLNYIKKYGKDKSWKELANQFGYTSEDAVRKLVKRSIPNFTTQDNLQTSQGETLEYNLDKGEIKVSHIWDHPPTPEEVIEHHKIDERKWRLSMVWMKMVPKGYLTSAQFSQKNHQDIFKQDFTDFLKGYKSPHIPISSPLRANLTLPKGSLLINKQDSHLNKYDIGGDNDIVDRFEVYMNCLHKTLYNANRLVNLQEITYIIGSDQFNSEWTQTTTKGTPQQNILPYNVAFNLICNHEVEVINTLLKYTPNLKIVYLQGNHDEFVGFHMVSWLNAYYRNQRNLTIDMSMECTKYFSVGDTAVCINHGDAQKPEQLAKNFPIAYKRGFADANFWYILSGDKHSELSRSIGGIKFYQIPALSTSVSHWDDKKGYNLRRGEMTSFLVEEGKGINYIIKEPIVAV